MIDINELTIGQAKETASAVGRQENPAVPFEVGKCYLIRTVTMIQLGRVKSIVGDFLVLEDAAWIADTGRFNECLVSGKPSEVEPFNGDAIVNLSAIVDAVQWNHALVTEVR